MPISEELQRRIAGFTGGSISDVEKSIMPTIPAVGTGVTSDEEMQLLQQAEAESGAPFTAEERESALLQIQNMLKMSQAPYYEQAQQIAGLGSGVDTSLIHAEAGDTVIPPDVLGDDPQLESYLEQKFIDYNIDPESRVVGSPKGIMSLDTGLQEMGFFKKVGKFLKKVVAPIAKVAQFIPGPWMGPAALIAKADTVRNVVRGDANPLALLSVAGPLAVGPSIKDSIAGIKGLSTAAGGSGGFLSGLGEAIRQTPGAIGSGITSLVQNPMGSIGNLFKSRNPDDYIEAGGVGSGNWVNKITGEALPKGITDPTQLMARSGSGIQSLTKGLQGSLFGTEGMAGGLEAGTGVDAGNFVDQQGNVYSKEQMQGAGLVDQSGNLVQQASGQFKSTGTGTGTGTGTAAAKGSFLSNLLGGSGGSGGMGGLAGLTLAGGLAGTLGKLAYDEAKKDKGVQMTPFTSMDATGRYNIEAELARRMGQQAPNPVEFGLLPAGTFPTLSGGQPMEQPMQARYGGPVMAYADGGDVSMEEFEKMNGGINGEGTETSDEIPAMLSDGEFVMTGQAVRGAGKYEMETGEGGIISLVPSLDEDRERGTNLMYQMMEAFAGQAMPA